MKEYRHLFELFTKHLADYTGALTGRAPSELYEPEVYMLSLGGKRLRPLLALIGCELFGKDPAAALGSALSAELFHNFSLIHDDILDAAPLRRNKATVHTKWNTNIAILSGDVMLVKAFQALSSYDDAQFRQLTTLLQRTAIEVCEGQQQDMNFEQFTEVSVEEYIRMIELKTAVLLGCCLQMGAINAGASEQQQKEIYDFGRFLGIAFQLNDDHLDAFSKDSAAFGKQPGGDILANKKTYLLTRALELANEADRTEIERLLGVSDKQNKINGMLSIYEKLDVHNLCREEADRYTQLALACLKRIDADAQKKQALQTFALELLNRQA